MTAAAGWSPWRPAHIHLIVSADGLRAAGHAAVHRHQRLPRQRRGERGQARADRAPRAGERRPRVHLRLRARRPRARRRSRRRMPKVAIVGGGIGGLVLALALRERGIGARGLRAGGRAARDRRRGRTVGQRHARAAAARARRAVEAVSVVPSALVIRRGISGEVIADHPIGRDGAYEATFGAPYYGVHRVALLQALGDRLAGDGLNLGHRCVGVEERRSGVELRFADGATAAADVVVGADGVHSVIRPHVVGEVRGRFSGTVGYRGLVPSRRCRRCPIRRRFSSGRGPGGTCCTTRSTGARRSTSSPSCGVPEWTNDAWMEECPVNDARRRVRRLASRRDRDGRRDRRRGALGAARPRAARALAHRPRSR